MCARFYIARGLSPPCVLIYGARRSAFNRLRLRPRILRDVSKVDMTTYVLGEKVASPICIAPTGKILRTSRLEPREATSARKTFAWLAENVLRSSHVSGLFLVNVEWHVNLEAKVVPEVCCR